MALVIAIAALAAVAALLAVLTRVEESLLQDPQVRQASRPAPLAPRAAAARVAAGIEPMTDVTPVPEPVVVAEPLPAT